MDNPEKNNGWVLIWDETTDLGLVESTSYIEDDRDKVVSCTEFVWCYVWTHAWYRSYAPAPLIGKGLVRLDLDCFISSESEPNDSVTWSRMKSKRILYFMEMDGDELTTPLEIHEGIDDPWPWMNIPPATSPWLFEIEGIERAIHGRAMRAINAISLPYIAEAHKKWSEWNHEFDAMVKRMEEDHE